MKKIIDTAAQTVTFTFEGELAPIVLAMKDVSPDCATHAMLHGFSARCGDAAAIQKSAENGYTVTEGMRRAAVEEMVTHYASGAKDWNLRAGTRKAPQNPVILQIAAKLGCTYEEAQAKVADQFLAEMSAA